eukprot:1136835-Pelagomonas_calceolata.AAC.1
MEVETVLSVQSHDRSKASTRPAEQSRRCKLLHELTKQRSFMCNIIARMLASKRLQAVPTFDKELGLSITVNFYYSGEGGPAAPQPCLACIS